MRPEEYIQHLTGVSKRLFLALSSLRGNPPQIEDALFQLASFLIAMAIVLIWMSIPPATTFKIKGQKWIDWKNDQAILRTNGSN